MIFVFRTFDGASPEISLCTTQNSFTCKVRKVKIAKIELCESLFHDLHLLFDVSILPYQIVNCKALLSNTLAQKTYCHKCVNLRSRPVQNLIDRLARSHHRIDKMIGIQPVFDQAHAGQQILFCKNRVQFFRRMHHAQIIGSVGIA